MKTLFLQSLSGSVVLLFLLAVWVPAGRRGLYRWLDRLLRLCVLLFLLPLPLLKGICKRVFVKLHISTRWFSLFSRDELYFRISPGTLSVMRVNGKIVLSRALWIWLAVSGVLILCTTMVFLGKLCRSVKMKHTVFGDSGREEADGLREWMAEEGKRLHLKRLPEIYLEREGGRAFTAGAFRPDVMLPAGNGPEEQKLILLHELCHIRRRDVLVKTLVMAVVCLHWFNPLVYVLPALFGRVCELCCDGMVLERVAPDKRAVYARLLVKQAEKPQKETLLGQIAFSVEKNLTKERVIFIMKEKKSMRMIRGIAALASAVVVAIAVLPVWAYELPPVLQDNDVDVRALNEQEGFERIFSTTGKGLYPTPTVKYEYQFTDEDGNIYEVDPFEPRRSGCRHAKTTWGSYQVHEKHGDGSCNVISYRAKYCPECGTVLETELASNTYFPKCIH